MKCGPKTSLYGNLGKLWGSRKPHKFCHVVSCFKFRVFFVQLCSTCSAWTQSSGQRVQLCSWFTPCGEQTLRLVAASTCCFKIPIGYFSDRSKGRQSYCCVQPIALKERWAVEPLSALKNGCDICTFDLFGVFVVVLCCVFALNHLKSMLSLFTPEYSPAMKYRRRDSLRGRNSIVGVCFVPVSNVHHWCEGFSFSTCGCMAAHFWNLSPFDVDVCLMWISIKILLCCQDRDDRWQVHGSSCEKMSAMCVSCLCQVMFWVASRARSATERVIPSVQSAGQTVLHCHAFGSIEIERVEQQNVMQTSEDDDSFGRNPRMRARMRAGSHRWCFHDLLHLVFVNRMSAKNL